jgi:hypothetical protein
MKPQTPWKQIGRAFADRHAIPHLAFLQTLSHEPKPDRDHKDSFSKKSLTLAPAIETAWERFTNNFLTRSLEKSQRAIPANTKVLNDSDRDWQKQKDNERFRVTYSKWFASTLSPGPLSLCMPRTLATLLQTEIPGDFDYENPSSDVQDCLITCAQELVDKKQMRLDRTIGNTNILFISALNSWIRMKETNPMPHEKQENRFEKFALILAHPVVAISYYYDKGKFTVALPEPILSWVKNPGNL